MAYIEFESAGGDFITGDGIHKITVGIVQPVNPQPGDLWLDTGDCV